MTTLPLGSLYFLTAQFHPSQSAMEAMLMPIQVSTVPTVIGSPNALNSEDSGAEAAVARCAWKGIVRRLAKSMP